MGCPRIDVQLTRHSTLAQPQCVSNILVPKSIGAADADIGGWKSGKILRAGWGCEIGNVIAAAEIAEIGLPTKFI
jgi:hypothetical protein